MRVPAQVQPATMVALQLGTSVAAICDGQQYGRTCGQSAAV
jgi:hypothetical protein